MESLVVPHSGSAALGYDAAWQHPAVVLGLNPVTQDSLFGRGGHAAAEFRGAACLLLGQPHLTEGSDACLAALRCSYPNRLHRTARRYRSPDGPQAVCAHGAGERSHCLPDRLKDLQQPGRQGPSRAVDPQGAHADRDLSAKLVWSVFHLDDACPHDQAASARGGVDPPAERPAEPPQLHHSLVRSAQSRHGGIPDCELPAGQLSVLGQVALLPRCRQA